MFRILLIAVGMLVTVSIIKYYFFLGWEESDFSSVCINLATESIGILITIFIINKVLENQKRKDEAKAKSHYDEEYKMLISNVLGNRLKRLFIEISSVYINFIQKEPLTTKSELTLKKYKIGIEDVLSKLDDYIIAGFRSTSISCYIVDEKNVSIPKEQIIGYQEFCEGIFKAKVEHVISEFVQRYISVLPNDLRLSIYTIENSIDTWIFHTALGKGLKAPMPTSAEDIAELKIEFKKIGEELIKIYDVIEKTA
jgi:hypothetical protein